jgi:hypothetical protein
MLHDDQVVYLAALSKLMQDKNLSMAQAISKEHNPDLKGYVTKQFSIKGISRPRTHILLVLKEGADLFSNQPKLSSEEEAIKTVNEAIAASWLNSNKEVITGVDLSLYSGCMIPALIKLVETAREAEVDYLNASGSIW